MGVYVVTGGSGGIGGATIDLLKEQGHEVVDVSLQDADICADLADPKERDRVIEEIHQLYPQGIDGLCCCAGVSGAVGNTELIVSLNYFGAVDLALGLYDLLKQKKGSCVMVSSNTISDGAARMDLVNMLNYHHMRRENERRILELVAGWGASGDVRVGHSVYTASKYALARWVRRASATWAANGVRLNAVAPGNVKTPMTDALQGQARLMLSAIPIPINYGSDELMEAEDIAQGIVFLLSPAGRGINGNVLFIDGGTDALLNSEKVY